MPELEPSAGEQRIIRISRMFGTLLPLILCILGIIVMIGVIFVPALQNPALLAAMAGMLTVIGTVGYAKRESK